MSLGRTLFSHCTININSNIQYPYDSDIMSDVYPSYLQYRQFVSIAPSNDNMSLVQHGEPLDIVRLVGHRGHRRRKQEGDGLVSKQ